MQGPEKERRNFPGDGKLDEQRHNDNARQGTEGCEGRVLF
jgi:hypothetical protein